jgi:hypothetical protein
MSAVTTRLIVFAGATPNPREPTALQRLLVEGVVAIRVDPALMEYTEENVTPNADFWDVLVAPIFDASSYVRLYEAEMQDDGTFVIKRDLFGPGDYPHTWAGWPIPGDPPPDQPTPTPLAALSPQSREFKALAPVRAKKGKK